MVADSCLCGLLEARSHYHYEPTDGECISSGSTSGTGTYASFGDNGTTASISAYGDLMQISTFLGLGRSGIFTVDSDKLSEPYLVNQRAGELQEMMAQGLTRGFGLRMQETSRPVLPKLEFLHSRWPRLTYKMHHLDITVQMLIHNGTVIQQYIIDSGWDEDFELYFDTDILIREQNYADNSHLFNEESRRVVTSYCTRKGPNGYGLILAHKLMESQNRSDSTTVDRTMEKNGISNAKASNDAEQQALKTSSGGQQTEDNTAASGPIEDFPEAICVVMALFIDGVARKLVPDSENDQILHKYRVPKQTRSTLTAAYKFFVGSSRPTAWQSLMIPAADIDVKKILTSDLYVTASAFRPFSQEPKLDFIFQRNLEHILSVCSIPIRTEIGLDIEDDTKPGTEPCIALTCGDIAGHRVSISGSLYDLAFLARLKSI